MKIDTVNEGLSTISSDLIKTYIKSEGLPAVAQYSSKGTNKNNTSFDILLKNL